MDANENSSNGGQRNPVLGISTDVPLGVNAVEEADEEQKENDEVYPLLSRSLMGVEEQQVELNKDSGLAIEAEREEDGHGEEEDQDRSDGLSLDDLISPLEPSLTDIAPEISGEVLSSVNDVRIPSALWYAGASKAEPSLENANKRLKMPSDFSIPVREQDREAGMVHELKKLRLEDEQKHQMEVRRLNKELDFTRNLVKSYEKEIEAERRSFAEYRARYGNPKMPLYMNSSGSDGLVSRFPDIERQHVKRLVIEKAFMHFGSWWELKLADLAKAADVLEVKLAFLEQTVQHLEFASSWK